MKQTELKVDGTGATMKLNLGFIPHAVEITNVTKRTQLIFTVNDEVNTLGITVAAAGTRAKATAGVEVTTTDDDIRGIILDGAAIVNIAGDKLVVKSTLLDYI